MATTPPPEGMSRRQAKLAARAAERAALTVDPRSFRNVGGECDLIALREFVASASVPLTIDGTEITLCTILPGAIPALRHTEEQGGARLVGLQSPHPSPRPDRDLAAAIHWVLGAAPGESLQAIPAGDNAPELSDYLSASFTPTITNYDNFNWWFPDIPTPDSHMTQALQAANNAMMRSRRLTTSTGAAWWVDTREKGHIRWVRPDDEDALFQALVRLHAAGTLTLGEGSRFAGMFRVHGLLVPVFDVDRTQPAEHWQEALDVLGVNVEQALQVTEPLTAAERTSRSVLTGRQVTIR